MLFASTTFAQGQQIGNVKNLGYEINSVYEESNPVISKDGKTLYFCRERHPENTGGIKDKGDVWYSEKDENGNWGKARNLGAPINNAFKNDIVGISSDGKTLYLHYDYGTNGKSWLPGLSYSRKTANGWSAPEKINIPYFYNISDHQSAFISEDETILILSLDSYGTYGTEDLYVSFKQASGQWSEPMNLGPGINTARQEMTPFLSKDNKTLFFVSNRPESIGSKDIFKSTRLDNSWKNWSTPQNLSHSINTEGMEMYYFQDDNSEFAYMASTQNSEGYGDIYQVKIREQDFPDNTVDTDIFPDKIAFTDEVVDSMFQVPDTVIVFSIDNDIFDESDEELQKITIKGKVTNFVTQEGIEALIALEGEQNAGNTNSEEGQFILEVPSAGKYKFNISAKGYMAKEQIIDIEPADSSKLFSFSLTPLEIGTTIQLKDVLFEQGTANILEPSYSQLDKVALMMLENPNLVIQLAGHTDNQGVARLNIKLSQERVVMVKKYLVKKGVEEDRISGVGYGGIKPIASNKSEETRKLNRRVEFTIVKN